MMGIHPDLAEFEIQNPLEVVVVNRNLAASNLHNASGWIAHAHLWAWRACAHRTHVRFPLYAHHVHVYSRIPLCANISWYTAVHGAICTSSHFVSSSTDSNRWTLKSCMKRPTACQIADCEELNFDENSDSELEDGRINTHTLH